MKIKLPGLTIKNFTLEHPIFQGGMGAGFSLHQLAGAVASEGGMGVISSAGIATIVSMRDGKKVDTYTALRIEIEKARAISNGGPIGVNIMCALANTYVDSVRAAHDAGADAIINGAGLPLGLIKVQRPKHTAIIPIVSSLRATVIVVERMERDGYRPDAIVLEGDLSGGHQGFKLDEIGRPEFALEVILPPILDYLSKHGNIPVIVAGGIYTYEDIARFQKMGARAAQLGTRFLATNQCSASDKYKQAVIAAKKEDIIVVGFPDSTPASPCGLPFRILKTSPMYTAKRSPKCNRGYVILPGRNGAPAMCRAMPSSPDADKFLCICNGLLGAGGNSDDEPALYTVGANAYRVNKILSVSELMDRLTGKVEED